MVDKAADQILGYLEESLNRHKGKLRLENDRKAEKLIRSREKYGIVANLCHTRYELIRKTVREAGFTIIDSDEPSDAFLIWTDNFPPLEKIMSLKRYQRINHFPGMVEICRKDFLAKNFNKIKKILPDEYDFMPQTWILPNEHGFFLTHARKLLKTETKQCFILKPANGAMGHGIRLYRNGVHVPANSPNDGPCVVQNYIGNPLLIDGYKCDLRVYVLITSCDPLRAFMYNEGLVRLGTEKYEDPNERSGESIYMHLTNYAVNKNHVRYNSSPDETDGSKRSFYFLNHYLRNKRQCDPNQVWHEIHDLIVKTLAIALPHLLHSYRLCQPGSSVSSHVRQPGQSAASSTTTTTTTNQFDPDKGLAKHLPDPFVYSSSFEILGFDILLDRNLKPWLIEVNRSPSFNGDQELDRKVKHGLLRDTLRLLNIRPTDKAQTELEQRITSVRRLFHPTINPIVAQPYVDRSRPVSAVTEPTVRKPHVRLSSIKSRPSMSGNARNVAELRVDEQISILRNQLHLVRKQLAMDFFEHHNSGNWRRIFPPDDPNTHGRYTSIILANFVNFHNGRRGDQIKEIEDTYLCSLTEDEILFKIKELMKKCPQHILQQYKHIHYSWFEDLDDSDLDDLDDSEPTRLSNRITDHKPNSNRAPNPKTKPNPSNSSGKIPTRPSGDRKMIMASQSRQHPLSQMEEPVRSTKMMLKDSKPSCDSHDSNTASTLKAPVTPIIKRDHSSTSDSTVKPLFHLVHPTKSMDILIDMKSSNYQAIDLILKQEPVHNRSPKTQCSIPLLHWESKVEPTTQALDPNTIFKIKCESLVKTNMTLGSYHRAVTKLEEQMRALVFYPKADTLLDSQTFRQNLTQFIFGQCTNPDRQSIADWVNQSVRNLCPQAFQSMCPQQELVDPQSSRTTLTDQMKHDYLATLDKLVKGLRIVRLMNRLKTRLVMHRGHDLRLLVEQGTKCSMTTVRRLAREPMLETEEICCHEFLRLCTEAFIMSFLESDHRSIQSCQ